jgi:hypothetical protein
MTNAVGDDLLFALDYFDVSDPVFIVFRALLLSLFRQALFGAKLTLAGHKSVVYPRTSGILGPLSLYGVKGCPSLRLKRIGSSSR